MRHHNRRGKGRYSQNPRSSTFLKPSACYYWQFSRRVPTISPFAKTSHETMFHPSQDVKSRFSRPSARNDTAAGCPFMPTTDGPRSREAAATAILVETHEPRRSVYGTPARLGRHVRGMNGTPGREEKRRSRACPLPNLGMTVLILFYMGARKSSVF